LSKSGQNTGGANVLSEIIPSGWTDQQIWNNVNEPWLRDAANRNDVIRVVSDPLKSSNIFTDLKDIPSSVFDSPSDLATYLKSLPSSKLTVLSFYGREVKWLSEQNYLFDTHSFKFTK
jgi:hypothetical protein